MALTSTFKAQIRDDIKDEIEDIFTYGAVGSDNTASSESDTALGSEVFRDTVDEIDKSASNSVTASLQIATTEANGNTVREIGWLDAASDGNLWVREVINAVNKTSDIQLYIDTTITITVEEV